MLKHLSPISGLADPTGVSVGTILEVHGEIVAVTQLGSGQHLFQVARAQRESGAASHTTGSTVKIIGPGRQSQEFDLTTGGDMATGGISALTLALPLHNATGELANSVVGWLHVRMCSYVRLGLEVNPKMSSPVLKTIA